MEERNQFKNMIQNNYSLFKNELKNQIMKNEITVINEREFCLMESNWVKELFKAKNYYANEVYFLSSQPPRFINILSKEIKEKFEIIRKELLEIIYGDYLSAQKRINPNGIYNNNFYFYQIHNMFDNSKTFSYVAGCNKLIIISENNSALLILNPIDSIINGKSFVIGILLKCNDEHNYNNELFKQLITSDSYENNKKLIINLKNNLIVDDSDENYDDVDEIKQILEKIRAYKRKNLLKNNRILICVNLYCYEKILKLEEKEKAFKEYDDYYLINNDWLNDYKSENNYNKICEILNKYEQKNLYNCWDYYNLRNYQFTILNDLVNEEQFKSLDNTKININEKDIIEENYNNSYIIHENLFQLLLNSESMKPKTWTAKKIKGKNCNIYIFDKLTISIGTLNENLAFNTIYIINFSTHAIFEEEKKILSYMPIKEYLKTRKCLVKIKNDNKPLNLYREKSILGNVSIIKENMIEESKYDDKLIDSEYNKNQIYHKKNIQTELSKLSVKCENLEHELNEKKKILNSVKKEKELLEEDRKKKEEESNIFKKSTNLQLDNMIKKNEELMDKNKILEEEKISKGNEFELILTEKNEILNKNRELELLLKDKDKENEKLFNKYSEIEKKLNEGQLLNKENEKKLKNYDSLLQEKKKKINDLERMNNQKEKEIDQLKSNNQNIDDKNREKENLLSEKEKEITDINNDNLNLKNKLKNNEDELINIKKELKKSKINLEQMENEIKSLKKAINEKDLEILKINQINNELQKCNENYNNLLKQYEEELKQTKKENIDNVNKLKNILNNNDNDNKKLKNEIFELTSKVSELQKNLKEKNDENETIKENMKSTKIKLEEMKDILEKVKSKYLVEQKKAQNLEQNLKSNEEQLNDSKNLIIQYENELKQSKSNCDELNKKLEKIIKENESKINDIIISNNNEMQIREKECKGWKIENEKIKVEFNELNRINQQLKNRNNELNNIIQIKNNEINNLRKIIEDNKSQKINEIEFQKILELNNELVEKNNNYKKQEKENLVKLQENQQKEKELNKMKNEINKEKLMIEKEKINYNNMRNEIQQLEQKKQNLNAEISNLNFIINELEKNIKNAQIHQQNTSSQNSNENQQQPPMQKYKDIINEEYSFSPNIGLNNVGATCFMNATLQCLSHTKRLTNYFLNPQNKERILNNNIALKNPNALQLTPQYLELISNLWAKNGSSNYSPTNFMNCIQSMNPLFKKGQAGDAKDFIIFILEQIHAELKKSMVKNKIELEPLNQYDKNNAVQHFFAEFQEEVSIISDIFFGFNETTNVCVNCRNHYSSKGQNYPICYNYGIFNVLIFPLEEVRKMKNQFMQMFGIQDNRGYTGMNNNRVSLVECFTYNQKTDKFTGENQNYCNICRKMSDSDYTSKIYISGNVLVMILNRGKGNIFDVKLDFFEHIDITDFVLIKDKPKITYNLYGVITHLGKSGPYAHFVASCKSPVDGKWYRFNDGLVSPISDFQSEIHDYGSPYILFYQKDGF